MFIYTAADGTRTTYDNAMDAMAAYAQAGNVGSITKAQPDVIDADTVDADTVDTTVDDVIDADVIDADTTAQNLTPNSHSRTGAGLVHSAHAEARIKRHELALNDLGIALPPPVFAAGTRVVSEGEEKLRTLHTEWENQPLVVDGLRQLWRTVKAEQRHDVTVPVRDIQMLDDGRINWGLGAIPLEARGLKQLVQRAGLFYRGAAYLADIRPDERAWNWNTRVGRSGTNNTGTVVLRIRTVRGQSQVYATVGEGYSPFDADLICEVLGKELRDSGMRGMVTYNPETTDIMVDGTYHADNVVDFAAGDVFKVGVRFRSNDAAQGSIKGSAIAWRNRCLNLIIIGQGSTELVKRVHRGAVNDVRMDMEAAASQARTMFKTFAEEWGVLRKTDAQAFYGVDSVKAVFEEITNERKWDGPLRRDAMVEKLLQTFAEEPGDSLADIINAITRTHMLAEIDNYQRHRLEQTAGALVPVLAKRA